MIDIRQDMKQAEAWLEKTNGEMSEEQLIYLAATGFLECSDFCGSKEYWMMELAPASEQPFQHLTTTIVICC